MSHGLNRRQFLGSCGAALGAAALGGGLARRALGAPLSVGGRPMNVLFISIDDLNDWTGTLKGHPQARTPNLDRLAAMGVNFSNAHCAGPVCGPSRAALMTGIRPSTSGVYGNSDSFINNPVTGDALSLPQAFRNAGYTVLGGGKLYHGAHFNEGHLGERDFDEYFPGPRSQRPPDPGPGKGVKLNGITKGMRSFWDWGQLGDEVGFEDMSDAKIARWAEQTLTERSFDTPFFLGVGLFRPHLPFYAPKKYFDMFPIDQVQLPALKPDDYADIPEGAPGPNSLHRVITDHDEWKHAVQSYLASVAFVDECVGVVLDALERSPHRDNTAIVLWSDHGWQHGQKEQWGKAKLWEQATQNVMMWKVPGLTSAGGMCEAPANLLDMYPTLAALCGLNVPAGQLEGYDLTPLLRNPDATWDKPTVVTHGQNNHAVRSRRYRYIRYDNGAEELYDHETDPHEWTNLAADPAYASVIAEHRQWLPKVNAEPGPRAGGGGGDGDE